MAFYEQTALRFHCTGCGRCCGGGSDHYAYLDEREAEAIRRHLGLTAPWFKRRYLRRDPDGALVLANAGDNCIFLSKENSCRIYAVRPLQCRTYPYWPETLGSQAAWRREALRCEGIGRGGVIPLARVRDSLAKHNK